MSERCLKVIFNPGNPVGVCEPRCVAKLTLWLLTFPLLRLQLVSAHSRASQALTLSLVLPFISALLQTDALKTDSEAQRLNGQSLKCLFRSLPTAPWEIWREDHLMRPGYQTGPQKSWGNFKFNKRSKWNILMWWLISYMITQWWLNMINQLIKFSKK